MDNLPPEVHDWFIDCGWTPNRPPFAVPDFVPSHHPAHAILSTFGGITLLERDCPEDEEPIHEFVFRPRATTDHHVQKWSKRLRSLLVGVADEHNDHARLYVDEKGRCFSDSQIHDCFVFSGESLADTLVGVLENRRCRPLLRPWQGSVSAYGEWISRGDPRIWDYKANR